MPETVARIPPSRGALTRLLRDRRAQTVDGVARLLGWTVDEVRERAHAEGAARRGQIRWRTVVAWMFETWPMRVVLDSLGEDVHLIPEAVHLTPIIYELPYYIVHAVKVQAVVEPLPHRVIRPATVSDYLADFLHRSIDPDTLTILRRDPTFRAAFDFVDGRDT